MAGGYTPACTRRASHPPPGASPGRGPLGGKPATPAAAGRRGGWAPTFSPPASPSPPPAGSAAGSGTSRRTPSPPCRSRAQEWLASSLLLAVVLIHQLGLVLHGSGLISERLAAHVLDERRHQLTGDLRPVLLGLPP